MVLKKEILRCTYGKYVWWPELHLVDFVSKGHRRGKAIGHLTYLNSTEEEALKLAIKHLTSLLKH